MTSYSNLIIFRITKYFYIVNIDILFQDCNGDGFVTCDDYAMIHKNGGYSCSNNIQGSDFWKIYSKCKDHVIGQGRNI